MNIRNYFRSGEAFVWLNAGAVTICLFMIIGIMGLIGTRGLAHFWPADILQATYTADGGNTPVIGEIYEQRLEPAARLIESGQPVPAGTDPLKEIARWSIKEGNKDVTGQDFKWVTVPFLKDKQYPDELYRLEREEFGNFYGRLLQVSYDGKTYTGSDRDQMLEKAVDRAADYRHQIHQLERGKLNSTNYELTRLNMHAKRLEMDNKLSGERKQKIDDKTAELNSRLSQYTQQLEQLRADETRDSAVFTIADGTEKTISMANILHAEQPNKMGVFTKVGTTLANIWHFLWGEPREANTEGGVFPAIYGTILMVLLMTVLVTPLGVVAAVYLREYAAQGRMTQLIRVAVNNLAGVPSIVYGVFGLGFFVYILGGEIDKLFYPETYPQPVFGTPGLLWSAITMALLTLPVVIVSTEEGLSRIPRSLKEGSLALGATKAETLWRVVLPMAAPSILTGMILAIARAAGEVAPLMLVGVVKFAAELPLDTDVPFLHLDRKFMHLGFHIYDVGFQSPNIEASRPLVYATALLLVIIVATLNMAAISIRNRLREKYKALEH